MKILETKNLVKWYNNRAAIDGISIGFDKGHITGIVGPNGSGKTTLINLLSGMIPKDSGKIVVNGNSQITRTFQNIRLFQQMTVLDNILVVITDRNIFKSLLEKKPSAEHYKIAQNVLQKVHLWEKRNQLAAHLSYGQQKLLEISRTRAMNAEIFLFDEPFAGLFPAMRNIVTSIMYELKQENKTVILIEHDMVLMRKLCDYMFVMDEGKLLAQGNPEKVLTEKKVVDAYIGS